MDGFSEVEVRALALFYQKVSARYIRSALQVEPWNVVQRFRALPEFNQLLPVVQAMEVSL